MSDPPTNCPDCGNPMSARCRRCYRCKPAGKRGPGRKPPAAWMAGRCRDVPTHVLKSLVAEADAVRRSEEDSDPLRSDPAAERREKFARLAAEERERTARERRSQGAPGKQ